VDLAGEVDTLRERVELLGARAGDLSPLGMLERGYAACFGPDGGVLRDAERVSAGDGVVVRLARGSIDCDVTGTHGEG
ncbi:MAG: exodeoxyribonuclease VII large subunit, partial [Actinobacteria bacterium]